MTTERNDGGPAFPTQRMKLLVPKKGDMKDTRPVVTGHIGMSLRDWFAGHYEPPANEIESACELLFPHSVPTGEAKWPMLCKRQARAKLRYMEADDMLAEREKGEQT